MPAPTLPVSVIAAYRFVDIDDCEALRAQWLPAAEAAGLKGTVLLAPEGINVALAGDDAALRAWFAGLCSDPRFAGLQAKWHQAPTMPFGRLRFRVKREIIRMNQPGVRPRAGRAPSVDAPTLARWLQAGRCDAGRPVVMLDTRNAFEVDVGAFEGAIDWRLHKFSDFPTALEQHAAELQGKTVVSYCTGGIRCEKAALWMAQQGLNDVLQLEGGILRYFEQTEGAPHWRGRCVVFDDRGAVDTGLAEAR
ncbi:MAG: sulfurtransferase [Rubrivivax sp.]|nr:sulfurtransferase [Rubrivivax sp.]